jgi:hypothetical protein
MRRVDYAAYLRLINRTETALNVARHRGEIALAFGREKPDKLGEYIDLDVIAWAIVDRLMRFFANRRDAAGVVRAFWPRWLVALALAEDAQEDDAGIFFVGGRKAAPDLAENWIVHAGSFAKVAKNLLAMPIDKRPTAFFYVDLWQTAEAVRAAMKREGVEPERFFYALDDPRCEATIREEVRKHADRIKRERKAGSPRAAKATAPAADEALAWLAEARRAVLQ